MRPRTTLALPPCGPSSAAPLPSRGARPLSLALALVSLLLVPAGAAAEHWMPLGPPGGDILSLLVDPLKPGHVYAGTLGGGVFASRDNGATWQQAADGLLASRVDALAKGATPNAPLYAGTDRGVFRLDEGSVTWRPASTGLPLNEIVGRLAVDPGQPSTLYATVTQGNIAGSWQLFKTTDGGAHWSLLPGAAFPNNTLAVSATSPPVLYVGSFLGVYRSTDRGATWEVSETGLPLSSHIFDLAVVPGSPDILFAAVLDSGPPAPVVWKSLDGGRSWSPASQGIPAIPLPFAATPLAIDPADPRVLYLGGMLGVFRTTDGGGSWTAADDAPADRAIRALTVAPSRGTVFAGGTRLAPGGDAGVLRSGDGGESWESLTTGLIASSVTSLSPDPLSAGRLLINTENQGIFRSDGAGGHWVPARTGIREEHTGPLVRDPFSPSTLYTLAGSSRSVQTQLYRTTDSGASWATVGADLGCCPQALTADPSTPGTLYLQREQRVLKSTDAGATWRVVNTLSVCPFETLAVHPENPVLLLGGCVVDSGLPVSPPIVLVELHRSLDGGATWTLVLEGEHRAVTSDVRLAFDPHDPDQVFAAESGFGGGGLYRSRDAGATWSKISSLDRESVRSVAVDPARPGQILVGTSQSGVLRSQDGGASWQPWSEGLGSALVWDLAFDPANPARVWAGTGGGVYTIERQPPALCVPSPTELCLHGRRFRVRVEWEDFNARTGTGQALPLTDATGGFWFFGPDNLEVAVKILDGGGVNGHFWVFFGGLSTVFYTIHITDTLTGLERRYDNPSGRLASFGDTSAFPAVGTLAGPQIPSAPVEPARLSLHEGRFLVEVRWRIEGTEGAGTGFPLSRDTAAVWFFGPENLELFLKILDGRALNGHYWLFFGALSNVGFEITVTDTRTGARRVYNNPPGTFGSRVDVELFQEP